MKKKITLLLMALLYLVFSNNHLLAQENEKVKVYIHEPIELLLTIYHLTPDAQKSIKQTKKERDWVDVMIQPLIAPYRPFSQHPVVTAGRELYKKYQIWLPTLISDIGVQVDGIPIDPALCLPKDQSQYAKDIRAFVELVNQFYVDTNFKVNFEKSKPFYQAIEEEVNQNMPNKEFFPMMESYYRKRFLSYNICPTPLLPAGNGMGFGPNRKTADGIAIFNVFSGIDKPIVDVEKIIQPNGSYGFNNEDWIRGISTHEFGHSFVNEPLFVFEKDFNKYKKLLKPIKKKMRGQGYWSWGTVLAEHLVRMGEIRIAEKLGLQEASNQLFEDYYLNRKFIYLPHFLEIIKVYEGNSDYMTFEDFIPEIVESMEGINAKKAKRAWKIAKKKNNNL